MGGDDGWSLTAPNGVGVLVEVVAVMVRAEEVAISLEAGATGLFNRHRLDRMINLPLTGQAARLPQLLYVVFETNGHVYAYESLDKAGEALEATDLAEGHYAGAFSDRGEVIEMARDGLWIRFISSGSFDEPALTTLIDQSRGPRHLRDNPHEFAMAVWLSA